jgi:hypothetical protein
MARMKNLLYSFYKPFLKKEEKEINPNMNVEGILIRPSTSEAPVFVKGKFQFLLDTIFNKEFSSITYKKTRINKDIFFYHYDFDVVHSQIYKPNYIATSFARITNPSSTNLVYYGPVFLLPSFIFLDSLTSSNVDISSHINSFPPHVTHQLYKIYEYTKTF